MLRNLPSEGYLLINWLLIKNMYSDIFRNNQARPGIIQAYSGIFRTSFNPDVFRTRDIFRTLVYSKAWCIQNLRPIQNPVKNLQWSILRKKLMTTIIYANYNYCCSTSFSRPLHYEMNVMIYFIQV